MTSDTKTRAATTDGLVLPEGFEMREPTKDDLAAVLELRNLCSREVEGRDEFTLDTFEDEWNDPSFDLATDAIVVVDASGRIVAWEEVYDRGANTCLEWLATIVHPDVRGRGIEEALRAWMERVAAVHVERAREGSEVVLRCGLHENDARGRELVTAAGLSLARHFHAMEIALDDRIPEPAWPDGVEVRSFVRGRDEREFFAAKNASFSDHWGLTGMTFEDGFTKFVDWTQGTKFWNPKLFRAATVGDEIAGVCLTWSQCHADTTQGVVSHIGVRKEFRRRGIAMALLLDAFALCRDLGKTSVSLGVDSANDTGATALYEKAGMKVKARYDAYTKVLREPEGGST